MGITIRSGIRDSDSTFPKFKKCYSAHQHSWKHSKTPAFMAWMLDVLPILVQHCLPRRNVCNRWFSFLEHVVNLRTRCICRLGHFDVSREYWFYLIVHFIFSGSAQVSTPSNSDEEMSIESEEDSVPLIRELSDDDVGSCSPQSYNSVESMDMEF